MGKCFSPNLIFHIYSRYRIVVMLDLEMAAKKTSPSEYHSKKLSAEKLNCKSKISGQFILRASIFLLCCSVTSAQKDCDPKDKNSCKFWGKCISITKLEQYHPSTMNKSRHVCICPRMSCYKLPERMQCGQYGGKKEFFFNDMCRILRECELQRNIERVCHGLCDDPDCNRQKKDSQLCPEKDHPDFCQNGGICKMVPKGEPYCQCPSGFDGERCQRKTIFGPKSSGGKSVQSSGGKSEKSFGGKSVVKNGRR